LVITFDTTRTEQPPQTSVSIDGRRLQSFLCPPNS